MPLKLHDLSALFIDVGGTLIRARRGVGGAYARVAAELDLVVEPETIGARFRSVFDDARDAARAAGGVAYGEDEATTRAFWRGVVAEVFAPWLTDEAKLDRLFAALFDHFATAAAWEVFPDVAPLLDAAQALALPVLAVSNWDARLPAILGAVGLSERLTAIVGSFAVGAEKPDPRIFEVALAALPESPRRDRILHVGDSLSEDVAGAEAAGLRAVHLDRSGRAGAGRIVSLSALHG